MHEAWVFQHHLDIVAGIVDQTDAEDDTRAESGLITITHGYSREHRPDLKQFIIDLMCTADEDIPLDLRVADGNRPMGKS